MRRKRIYGLGILIFIGLAILTWRLSSIQLFATENFSNHHINLIESSVSQRTQELEINDGRGQFLDRKGNPLTFTEKPVVVIFPFLKKTVWDKGKVASILHISSQQLEEEVQKASKPMVLGGKTPIVLDSRQEDQINSLEIPGLFAVKKSFAVSSHIAEDILGFTAKNDNLYKRKYPDRKDIDIPPIGVEGLQKTFDEFLLPDGASKLVYHVDGEGQPLFGNKVKYVEPANPFYPVYIKTTIDQEIQMGIDDILRKRGMKKGGAVLLDIKTGDILAMASLPDRSEKDPYKNGGAVNYMLKQETPGSVFKTVIAAAAIEKGAADEKEFFECSTDLYGKEASRELGKLNFDESFSQSCNRTFGETAKKLMEQDPDTIESFAQKLGLIGGAGWQGDLYHVTGFHQFEEDKGTIFINEENKSDANFIAQTGIGQKDVSVTPLAVANMMAAIARGGEKKMARAVSEIDYQNGTAMFEFPEKDLDGSTISPYTAIKLQRLLRLVVTGENGTGKSLNGLPYDVAGKSGTAQTGKGDLYNKWFAGYFPFEKPRYALAVVNLDVADGEGGVNPMFADIVQFLYEKDQQTGNEALPNQ
ncbi:peptidoglycan D,D-transpeptidase FtsI family protein [Falsibacillus pallidus]|uniref:Cell division protein FtsI/penicillin-binding protein 2 n=1 Tax=Falsibacillus pallidus TaxID=493781 RepID=A0A370GLB6_9BACI|nr:penicillin-binding transpeptidase domain-containing protein [Falsibacillus pallidus]RDI44079.1 cell division protein FtsI/penicillin-binding protein 2 [Falsibacillus pallidus]